MNDCRISNNKHCVDLKDSIDGKCSGSVVKNKNGDCFNGIYQGYSPAVECTAGYDAMGGQPKCYKITETLPCKDGYKLSGGYDNIPYSCSAILPPNTPSPKLT